MNETNYIRQQLAAERVHLREILQAMRQASGVTRNARPMALYIDWASQRLVQQLGAHRAALQAADLDAHWRAQLAKVSGAMTRAAENGAAPAPHRGAERLLALLETWSDALDALAGRTLRIAHWRQAAQLSADTILEERRLYAAARAAAGLS